MPDAIPVDADADRVPYSHIVLATDFSAHSERAALRALDLARRYEAKISLIHVLEDMFYYDDLYDPVIPDREAFEQQLETHALRKLNEFAERLGLGSNAHVELLQGSPKGAIVSYAHDAGADLIVLGTHGRRGIAQLLGSVAAGVTRSAPCDVLTVRL